MAVSPIALAWGKNSKYHERLNFQALRSVQGTLATNREELRTAGRLNFTNSQSARSATNSGFGASALNLTPGGYSRFSRAAFGLFGQFGRSRLSHGLFPFRTEGGFGPRFCQSKLRLRQ